MDRNMVTISMLWYGTALYQNFTNHKPVLLFLSVCLIKTQNERSCNENKHHINKTKKFIINPTINNIIQTGFFSAM